MVDFESVKEEKAKLDELVKAKESKDEGVKEKRLNTHIKAHVFDSIMKIKFLEDITVKKFVSDSLEKSVNEYIRENNIDVERGL